MLMTYSFVPANDPRRSNPRAASIRLETRNASRLYGQRRHDLRTSALPGYVDPERVDLNRLLIPYPHVCEVRDICKERRSQRETERAMSRTTSIAMTGIITFGSEAAVMFDRLSPADQDAAFRDLVQAVADRLNTSVSGLTVHLDETTIHAHFELIGYTHAGQPLSQSTRPGIFSELQDLTAEIMGHHCPGIERGRRYGTRLANGAEFREILHRSVKQLHHDLPSDLAELSAEVATGREVKAGLERDIEALQARIMTAKDEIATLEPKVTEAQSSVDAASERVAEMEGYLAKAQVDLDKAGADAARKAKVAKRIKTYAKRLGDRNVELESSKAELEKTVARLRTAKETFTADVSELKTLREKMLRDAKAEAEALKVQQDARLTAATAEAGRIEHDARVEAEKATAGSKAAAEAEAERIKTAAEAEAKAIVRSGRQTITSALNFLETVANEVESATLTVGPDGAPTGSRPGMLDTAPPLVLRIATRLGGVMDRLRARVGQAAADERAAKRAREEAEAARDQYQRGLDLQRIFRETAEAQLALLDRHMDAARDKTTGEIKNLALARFFTEIRDGVEDLGAEPAEEIEYLSASLTATP